LEFVEKGDVKKEEGKGRAISLGLRTSWKMESSSGEIAAFAFPLPYKA
jgi:hypothetical protein